MRDVLRQPGMGLLLAGQTTSMFGDWTLLLVLGIWIRALGGSNGLAGAAMLAIAAPSLVSPVFGWVVDRFRRRPFLIVVNLLSGVMLTPLLLVHNRHDIWIIFAVAVLYGVSQSVTAGAFSGLIKKLVPDDLLGSANSLFASVRQLLRLCGPLVGAGLFAAYGGRAVALLDAASFVAAAGALATVRLTETRPTRTRLHWLHELPTGVRHIQRVPALRRTITAVGTCMLALGAVDTMIFAYVDEGLHRPPTFLGVLVSVQGVGVLIGALLTGRIMARLGEVTVAAIGILTFGIAIAIAVDPVLYLAFIAMPFAGIGNAVVGVAFNTLLQRRTPDALMGRASAAADMVIGGAATLSMALGATLVAFIDYRLMFAVISVVVFVTGALLWRIRQSDPTVPAPSVAPIDPAGELVGDHG